jgi:dynactin complex subunit
MKAVKEKLSNREKGELERLIVGFSETCEVRDTMPVMIARITQSLALLGTDLESLHAEVCLLRAKSPEGAGYQHTRVRRAKSALEMVSAIQAHVNAIIARLPQKAAIDEALAIICPNEEDVYARERRGG